MSVVFINEHLGVRRARTENNRAHIALIADGDAGDRNTMSGTPFYCARALQEHCGDVTAMPASHMWLQQALRLGNAPIERLTGYRYSRSHSCLLARLRSRSYGSHIRETEPDVIFSAKDCKGIAYLESNVPVVYWTDATFRGICNYYPSFSNLLGISLREGEILEQRALERADHIITLSEWAARSVVEDYGIPEEKVSAFPFGPKCDALPDREASLNRTLTEPVQLLFIGGSWERKGGPLALAILKDLQARGINATLRVVGCKPDETAPGLEVIPYRDKNTAEGARQLAEIYLSAHFFVMPVRQEAGGSVFVEAAAYGLPSLACRTGGVPDLVRPGISGQLFALNADATAYADYITSLLNNPARYRELVLSTRKFVEDEANWKTWGQRVCSIFSKLLKRPL